MYCTLQGSGQDVQLSAAATGRYSCLSSFATLVLLLQQMQTRSADEPMTTFVTCVNCGNKWKFW
jgi:transcription elongation factor S-II